jgi:hypothetical protein
MIQKPISISVIVAVLVTAILTLTMLPAASSTNPAFAQVKKPTSLSIGTYPRCSEIKTSLPTAHPTFIGGLTSEGSAVGGATIHIIGASTGFWFDKTSEFGRYSITVDLGPGTYNIHAHYGGDSDHESSDSRTLTCTVAH